MGARTPNTPASNPTVYRIASSSSSSPPRESRIDLNAQEQKANCQNADFHIAFLSVVCLLDLIKSSGTTGSHGHFAPARKSTLSSGEDGPCHHVLGTLHSICLKSLSDFVISLHNPQKVKLLQHLVAFIWQSRITSMDSKYTMLSLKDFYMLSLHYHWWYICGCSWPGKGY
ncbi:hypothetical protein pdam_00009901 [Pocillopora damicornis]|uniref:Uncharacterized protein n=1 Tax=Pocillopora damicornis TaxID=46731 RepID=A0A3M6TGU6_POCDA|nr:hypothetical protein pdam_00009901 [Pocillopora damicornis]